MVRLVVAKSYGIRFWSWEADFYVCRRISSSSADYNKIENVHYYLHTFLCAFLALEKKLLEFISEAEAAVKEALETKSASAAAITHHSRLLKKAVEDAKVN